MTIWIIVFILFFLAAVIFFSSSISVRKRSREDYLKDFAKYVEGQLEPMKEFENSFSIKFDFEGYRFIYEDVEDKGFVESHSKAYLKLATPWDLTISFLEKKPKMSIRSQVIMTSELSEETVTKKAEIHIPSKFKDFNVVSNDTELTNMLFNNSKFVSILCEYRNLDERGFPFLSWKISQGVISLEFYKNRIATPALDKLYNQIPLVEDFAFKAIALYKVIDDTYKQLNRSA